MDHASQPDLWRINLKIVLLSRLTILVHVNPSDPNSRITATYGKVSKSNEQGPEREKEEVPVRCPECNGAGQIIESGKRAKCKRCNGSGEIRVR